MVSEGSMRLASPSERTGRGARCQDCHLGHRADGARPRRSDVEPRQSGLWRGLHTSRWTCALEGDPDQLTLASVLCGTIAARSRGCSNRMALTTSRRSRMPTSFAMVSSALRSAEFRYAASSACAARIAWRIVGSSSFIRTYLVFLEE